MTSSGFRKFTVIASRIGLTIFSSAIFTLTLSVSLVSVPVMAQPADAVGHGPVGYDRAHEISMSGTITEVIATPEPGSPVGLHLMVAGAQGMVDAHIGPYMTEETQEALHAGTPVEMVGAMETVHGKDYFLVRQVTVGGLVVKVRSANGILLRAQSSGARHRVVHEEAVKTAATESNGGAR
jgi:hypothetical protein